jgi:hypothetical protein
MSQPEKCEGPRRFRVSRGYLGLRLLDDFLVGVWMLTGKETSISDLEILAAMMSS